MKAKILPDVLSHINGGEPTASSPPPNVTTEDSLSFDSQINQSSLDGSPESTQIWRR